MEKARQSLKQSAANLAEAKKRLEVIARAGSKSQNRVKHLESLLAMQTTVRDRAARERGAAEAARTAASAAAEADVIDIVGYGSDDDPPPQRRVASRTELNEQDYCNEGKFALKVHSFKLPATLLPSCYLATFLLPCYLAT